MRQRRQPNHGEEPEAHDDDDCDPQCVERASNQINTVHAMMNKVIAAAVRASTGFSVSTSRYVVNEEIAQITPAGTANWNTR